MTLSTYNIGWRTRSKYNSYQTFIKRSRNKNNSLNPQLKATRFRPIRSLVRFLYQSTTPCSQPKISPLQQKTKNRAVNNLYSSISRTTCYLTTLTNLINSKTLLSYTFLEPFTIQIPLINKFPSYLTYFLTPKAIQAIETTKPFS